VESSATQVDGYSALANFAAKDGNGNWILYYFDEAGTSGTWYRVRPYNSSSLAYGPYSTPIQATTFSSTYTTPTRVARLLQVTPFGGDTSPSIYDVYSAINEAEDEIDRKTGHAWRTRYNATSTGAATSSGDYEYRNIIADQMVGAGIPIQLSHRFVSTLTYNSGDRLEVFDGNGYTDYLTNRTEGRANDYWLENAMGILYVRDITRTTRELSLRVKYRYGEAAVPYDVRRLATLLTAITLATSDDRSMMTVEGGSNIGLSQKVELWQKQADAIMFSLTEWNRAGR